MIPHWFHDLAVAMLLAGFACAAIIAVDETRHHQRMWIMNVVWPVTALFGTFVAFWAYFTYGRNGTREATPATEQRARASSSRPQTPFPVMVGKGAAHCGSGCTLGDIAAEWLAYAVPAAAVWFGWHSVFPDKIFAVWVIDYLFAYAFGIVFQYFTIAPMRGLQFRAGIFAAIKADTLSLTAWQIGMYGFMAVAQFYIFGTLFGSRLQVDSAEFWFMMQIAMICGFITAYPVNWWLIRIGLGKNVDAQNKSSCSA